MTSIALQTMDVFRRNSPELFYELYPIPECARTDDSWQQYLSSSDILSHPYDPLLVMACAEPELFCPQTVMGGALEPQRSTGATTEAQVQHTSKTCGGQDCNSCGAAASQCRERREEDTEECKREEIGEGFFRETPGAYGGVPLTHYLVGNTPDRTGVVDIGQLHRSLCYIVAEGLRGCQPV